ncbi:hypothetical protein DL770_009939 [Monosporascus sp. CRB-9-2]|nr:hypothetical protein DL770_009939 [Monosporascus sp. CRB-9-2]
MFGMLISSGVDPIMALLYLGVAFIITILLNYAYDIYQYHRAHSREATNQLPPKYPTLPLYLGSVIPFLLNCPGFLTRATSYAGQLTSTRIAFLPGCDIYFFQDRQTVKQIWKYSHLMKSVSLRIFFYKYIFGMPERWLSMYYEDDSGPFPRPYPGTNVPPEKRIHYILYEGTHQALAGNGFNPALQRFRAALLRQIDAMKVPEEWLEMDNFQRLILHTVGKAFIESIFGPSLIRINPTFMDDLKEFNRAVPSLSKGTPRFLIPRAISEDGDGDPFWGSAWMRHRQKTLAKIQDDETLASSDLGVAWGSIVNLVPSTIMAMVHILEDKSVCDRVQREIGENFSHQALSDIELKRVSNNHLLSSIYAETLRLHVKLNTVVSSQRVDLKLGKWWLPRGSIGLVNSHISHMDSDFWNTKNGLYPVEKFWADRFLTDPADPSSGPINLAHREAHELVDAKRYGSEGARKTKPYFSMDGLEASWVPYGGGHLICPGRFLAKNAIIFTCVLLLGEFDIELLSDVGELCSSNFGIGTEEPKHPVKFRIRRKRPILQRK